MSETYVAGDRLTWHRESRGGYGFISQLPVVVERATPKRLRVLVQLKRGGFVSRMITPDRVNRRAWGSAVDDEFARLSKPTGGESCAMNSTPLVNSNDRGRPPNGETAERLRRALVDSGAEAVKQAMHDHLKSVLRSTPGSESE